jgi:membrane-bound metal-dependent hydrolase YbcI (DUF457 family)
MNDSASSGLDAQAVAECLAAAVESVHRSGKPVYVRLGTIKLGADLWQRYSVRFDGRHVWVGVGPLVDGSQAPVAGKELDGCAVIAAPAEPPVSQGDDAVVVDVFSGTALEFRPYKERVEVVFLPWHRQWSHSLIVAACLGGAISLSFDPLAGLVFALGSLVHILEDQLGYMGSNLLYPFTRRRIGGLALLHSGDVLPNLFVVWLSAVLLLLNLDRFSSAPVFEPWRLFLGGFAIPCAVIGALWWLDKHRRHHHKEICDKGVLETSSRPGMLVDVSQDGERGNG